jgi:diguanylate cyclase (GGDEF)-like protein
MEIAFALNTVFGSALIVALVFADYIRKYHTDRIQRTIFCGLSVFLFAAMMCNMVIYLFRKMPGETMHLLQIVFFTLYYVFKVLGYYSFFLFIDHLIYKDSARVKKLAFFALAINIAHLATLLLNLKLPFYFYIDQENVFHYGKQYVVHLGIAYAAIAFSAYELAASRGKFKKSHLLMLLILLALSSVCSTTDILLGTVKLLWPCLTATLLYSYFFIIQIDTRLDSLTGIGNRYSFNEFTDRLSRRNTGESWAVVMIDMDHFKEINDTLGHEEGDNALRDTAAIIKNCLGPRDFAARYGGDEFVAATRAENGAMTLMRRIQDTAARQNESGTRPYKLEFSYGYDIYTADGSRTIEDFLSHIDGLMYKHKERRQVSGQKGEVV